MRSLTAYDHQPLGIDRLGPSGPMLCSAHPLRYCLTEYQSGTAVSAREWDNYRVGQLQIFTTSQLAKMRDPTASRSYSPGRDEFRRTHERHRAWGLARRHAERLRHVRGRAGDPSTAATTRPGRTSQPDSPRRPEPTCPRQATSAPPTRKTPDQPRLKATARDTSPRHPASPRPARNPHAGPARPAPITRTTPTVTPPSPHDLAKRYKPGRRAPPYSAKDYSQIGKERPHAHFSPLGKDAPGAHFPPPM